jgi:hypothetical protein
MFLLISGDSCDSAKDSLTNGALYFSNSAKELPWKPAACDQKDVVLLLKLAIMMGVVVRCVVVLLIKLCRVDLICACDLLFVERAAQSGRASCLPTGDVHWMPTGAVADKLICKALLVLC